MSEEVVQTVEEFIDKMLARSDKALSEGRPKIARMMFDVAAELDDLVRHGRRDAALGVALARGVVCR